MEDPSFQTHPLVICFLRWEAIVRFWQTVVHTQTLLFVDDIALKSLAYLESFLFPLYFERNQSDFQLFSKLFSFHKNTSETGDFRFATENFSL